MGKMSKKETLGTIGNIKNVRKTARCDYSKKNTAENLPVLIATRFSNCQIK
jgi:hypothetical protein